MAPALGVGVGDSEGGAAGLVVGAGVGDDVVGRGVGLLVTLGVVVGPGPVVREGDVDGWLQLATRKATLSNAPIAPLMNLLLDMDFLLRQSVYLAIIREILRP